MRVWESRQDIDNFKNKFGEKTYDDFIRAKDRLKNNNISTDLTYHTKNTSPEEMDQLIQSLYNRDTDKQRLRQIRGEDKQIRGKYKYLGTYQGLAIYQPLDHLSSMDLGVNTGWCTTGRYGHAGNPSYTPSESDASEHFYEYTNDYGVKLFYFLDPQTMYGKYAVAVYPEVRNINREVGNLFIEKANFEVFNDLDYLCYDELDNIPLAPLKQAILKQAIVSEIHEVDDNGFCIENGKLIYASEKKLYYESEIDIPDGVHTIGEYAFDSMDNAEIIRIPESVGVIEESAFYCCRSLREISIPKYVRYIPDNCFAYCHSLEKIDLPSGLLSIGRMAFMYCSSLEKVKLPVGLQSIESKAFGWCSYLEEINIPNTVIVVGDNILRGCDDFLKVYVDKEWENGRYKLASHYNEEFRPIEELLHCPADQIVWVGSEVKEDYSGFDNWDD